MERTVNISEVVFSSALGGSIATVAACAIGFPWWPAAIVGVGIGAFFCFRPEETVAVLREVGAEFNNLYEGYRKLSYEQRQSFWKDIAWILWGVCVFVLSVESVAAILAFLNISAIHPHMTPFLMTLVTWVLMLSFGISIARMSLAILEYLDNNPKTCGWFLLRALAPAFRYYSETYELLDDDDRGNSPSRVMKATLFSLALVFFYVFFVAMSIAFVLDAVFTLALALASKPRLAVMQGTMIGGTIGYVTFIAHPVLPVATFVGMLAGGTGGGVLYCVRSRIVAMLKAAA